MSNSDQPDVNFYFGKLPDSDLLNEHKDNGALKYILLQNDQYHRKNTEMEEKCKNLEGELNELESSHDSLEKTRNCLRGYIRNEHEVSLAYKQLYQISNRMSTTQTNSFWNEIYLISILILVNFILGQYIFNIASLSGILGFKLYLHYDQINHEENQKRMRDLLFKVKETEKSNSYLDELIDNM